jgi:glycosyltransferase involved in cell wall biosynthesis
MHNKNIEDSYLEFTNFFIRNIEMEGIRKENLIKRIKMSLILLGKCEKKSNVNEHTEIKITKTEFEHFYSLDPSLVFYIVTARIPSVEDSKMANWYHMKGNGKQEFWLWLYRCVSESVRLKSLFENVIFIKPANNTIMDVTHTSTYPFLTGIQRVVINIKEHTSEEERTLAYWYFDTSCLLFLHDKKFRNMFSVVETRYKPNLAEFGFIALMSIIYIVQKNKKPLMILQKIKSDLRRDIKKEILSKLERKREMELSEANKLNQLINSEEDYYLSPFICNSTFIETEIPQHPNSSLAIANFKSTGKYKLKAILYDLIPVTRAHFVDQGIFYPFNNYLQLLLKSDEIIAISKLVAEQWKLFIKISIAPFRGIENNQIVKYHELPTDHDQHEPVITHQKFETYSYDFVMVGSLEPRKNHFDLLIVIEKLAQSEIRPSFAIIGTRGWKNSVELHILNDMKNRNINVSFMTELSDTNVRNIILGSKASIFLSKDEGFGLPVSESLLLGKRVICYGVEPFLSINSDNLVFIETIEELQNNIIKIYNESNSCIKGNPPEARDNKWGDWVKFLEL